MAVELLLGCFGLVSLPYLDYLGGWTAGSGYRVTSVCMVLFLLIPTLLMGMTLPLIVKIFSEWVPDFLRTVAFLYFINTLGAAVGALVASYGIISFLGLDWCIFIAGAINLILAGFIYLAGRSAAGQSSGVRRPHHPHRPRRPPPGPARRPRTPPGWAKRPGWSS